jgi:predicted site-specific integrase-resolvase
MEPSEKLLSRVVVAGLLEVSVYTVRRYERQGKLHAVRLSANCVRYRESEVAALIESATK